MKVNDYIKQIRKEGYKELLGASMAFTEEQLKNNDIILFRQFLKNGKRKDNYSFLLIEFETNKNNEVINIQHMTCY